MPVGQVDHEVLGVAQHVELLPAPFGADDPGLQVLAAQQRVDVLEPSRRNPSPTATRSSWSGLGSMKWLNGDGPPADGRTAARENSSSPRA
jgi:hypothetical protein